MEWTVPYRTVLIPYRTFQNTHPLPFNHQRHEELFCYSTDQFVPPRGNHIHIIYRSNSKDRTPRTDEQYTHASKEVRERKRKPNEIAVSCLAAIASSEVNE